MTEQPTEEELIWSALFGPAPDLELSADDQATYDQMFTEE